MPQRCNYHITNLSLERKPLTSIYKGSRTVLGTYKVLLIVLKVLEDTAGTIACGRGPSGMNVMKFYESDTRIDLCYCTKKFLLTGFTRPLQSEWGWINKCSNFPHFSQIFLWEYCYLYAVYMPTSNAALHTWLDIAMYLSPSVRLFQYCNQ